MTCTSCGRVDCSEHLQVFGETGEHEVAYLHASELSIDEFDGAIAIVLDNLMAFDLRTAADVTAFMRLLAEARDRTWPVS